MVAVTGPKDPRDPEDMEDIRRRFTQTQRHSHLSKFGAAQMIFKAALSGAWSLTFLGLWLVRVSVEALVPCPPYYRHKAIYKDFSRN
jgi:hypothetical protein